MAISKVAISKKDMAEHSWDVDADTLERLKKTQAIHEQAAQVKMRGNPRIPTGVIPGALNTVSLSAQTIPGSTLETNIAREEYLEKTQSMRVVALNEACSIAKAMIEKGATIDNTQIVQLAGKFTAFLVDART